MAAAALLFLVGCWARTAAASGPVGHDAHLAAMDRIHRLEETVQSLLLAQQRSAAGAPYYDAETAAARSPGEDEVHRRLQTPMPMPEPPSGSKGELNTATDPSAEPEALPPAMKAHACLQILGWAGLAIPGALVARRRGLLADGALDGQAAGWFTAHRNAQVAGVILSLIGTACALSSMGVDLDHWHNKCGLFLGFLGLAQVGLGMARPAADAGESRRKWAQAHMVLGITSVIIALFCICTGLSMTMGHTSAGYVVIGCLLVTIGVVKVQSNNIAKQTTVATVVATFKPFVAWAVVAALGVLLQGHVHHHEMKGEDGDMSGMDMSGMDMNSTTGGQMGAMMGMPPMHASLFVFAPSDSSADGSMVVLWSTWMVHTWAVYATTLLVLVVWAVAHEWLSRVRAAVSGVAELKTANGDAGGSCFGKTRVAPEGLHENLSTDAAEPAPPLTPTIPSSTLFLKITGMTCDGCSNRIEGALKGTAGVLSAEISHAAGSGVIQYSATDAKNFVSAVVERISDLGYEAIEDQDAAILCYAACASNVEAAAAPESPPVLEGFTEMERGLVVFLASADAGVVVAIVYFASTYLLMLATMTFEVGVIASVVVGRSLGQHWMRNRKFGSGAGSELECCTS